MGRNQVKPSVGVGRALPAVQLRGASSRTLVGSRPCPMGTAGPRTAAPGQTLGGRPELRLLVDSWLCSLR